MLLQQLHVQLYKIPENCAASEYLQLHMDVNVYQHRVDNTAFITLDIRTKPTLERRKPEVYKPFVFPDNYKLRRPECDCKGKKPCVHQYVYDGYRARQWARNQLNAESQSESAIALEKKRLQEQKTAEGDPTTLQQDPAPARDMDDYGGRLARSYRKRGILETSCVPASEVQAKLELQGASGKGGSGSNDIMQPLGDHFRHPFQPYDPENEPIQRRGGTTNNQKTLEPEGAGPPPTPPTADSFEEEKPPSSYPTPLQELPEPAPSQQCASNERKIMSQEDLDHIMRTGADATSEEIACILQETYWRVLQKENDHRINLMWQMRMEAKSEREGKAWRTSRKAKWDRNVGEVSSQTHTPSGARML